MADFQIEKNISPEESIVSNFFRVNLFAVVYIIVKALAPFNSFYGKMGGLV